MPERDAQGRTAAEQPAWRCAFPIDTAQDHYVARRDFTKFLVLTSLAFAVGQVCLAIQNWFRRRRGELPVRAVASLQPDGKQLPYLPVGGAVLFHYPEEADSCLLLRPDEGKLLAYDQKCTHLSCAVVPDIEAGCLNCPCHKGTFDLATGRPLAGPPRRPLPLIALEVRAGVVYAVGKELRAL
jgi:Rieske Fe-S protein